MMAAFALRRFTDPGLLRTIAPQRLTTLLLPWRDYLVGRGLDFPNDGSGKLDCDALAELLMAADASAPKDMIDTLYYVNETASEEDMDVLLDMAKLRKVAIEYDPNTTVADVAVQMWLASPELVQERHAENIAFRQKSFLYYAGARRAKREFPSVDDDLRLRIEAELDDWFEEHRRGRRCRLFLFPHGEKVWILIRHALPLRRESSYQEDGTPSAEVYRPQQHDVMIYDTRSDELGVHTTTKGETKLYLRCLGRLVFGDEGYFPPADKFTLDPLINDCATSLLCEDVDGLERIRLIEYRRFWGGAHQEIEIRKASDLFAALAERNQQLGAVGRLVGATFKVKFPGSRKERSVTIRPPGAARYERNEDSELIELWLSKRGFILKAELKGDDDETLSPVLESP